MPIKQFSFDLIFLALSFVNLIRFIIMKQLLNCNDHFHMLCLCFFTFAENLLHAYEPRYDFQLLFCAKVVCILSEFRSYNFCCNLRLCRSRCAVNLDCIFLWICRSPSFFAQTLSITHRILYTVQYQCFFLLSIGFGVLQFSNCQLFSCVFFSCRAKCKNHCGGCFSWLHLQLHWFGSVRSKYTIIKKKQ